MNIENQQSQNNQPLSPTRQIVEYPTLVDTVQLSTARRLDINGSFNATSFAALLEHRTDSERESIINEVGGHFDSALIQFVVGSLTGRRYHETVILAESAEGVNGHLPWEAKLLGHIALLQERGLLRDVSVQIERYSSDYAEIEQIANNAQVTEPTHFEQKHAA